MAARRKTTGTIGSPTIARRISRRRGFAAVQVRERGTVGRGRKKAFNEASRLSWFDTGKYYHGNLRERRFTKAHQTAAGFAKRKGELLPRGSKAFARSYTGKKLRAKGHDLALVFSGTTKRNMRIQGAAISSTSNKVRIAYRSASVFSFRHPKSRIRMSDEFRRILPSENQDLAEVYDAALDSRWE